MIPPVPAVAPEVLMLALLTATAAACLHYALQHGGGPRRRLDDFALLAGAAALVRWASSALLLRAGFHAATRGRTPLLRAAAAGDAEAMARLLSAAAGAADVGGDGDWRARDDDGYSVAHLAAASGSVCALRMALGVAGAEAARWRGTANRWTPLHVAAAVGARECAEELCRRGADPDARDVAGHTPLIVAACNGHDGVILALLDAMADATARTDAGLESALYLAARNARVEAVEVLLCAPRAAEQLRAETVNGATPLHAACAVGCAPAVRALLEAGAPVNAARKDGFTRPA
eukprot:m51a1_g6976 hypothetical protein (292) ;mRNA; r:116388-117372